MNANIIENAKDIVSKKDTVSTFGLVDRDGFPFVSAVVAVKNHGMEEFWISTSPDSRKAEIIGGGCKAGLCYYDGDNNITLMGMAQIVNNLKLKKELWLDWMKNYFKQGPEDATYCLIKFTAQKARICMNGPAQDFSIEEIKEALS